MLDKIKRKKNFSILMIIICFISICFCVNIGQYSFVLISFIMLLIFLLIGIYYENKYHKEHNKELNYSPGLKEQMEVLNSYNYPLNNILPYIINKSKRAESNYKSLKQLVAFLVICFFGFGFLFLINLNNSIENGNLAKQLLFMTSLIFALVVIIYIYLYLTFVRLKKIVLQKYPNAIIHKYFKSRYFGGKLLFDVRTHRKQKLIYEIFISEYNCKITNKQLYSLEYDTIKERFAYKQIDNVLYYEYVLNNNFGQNIIIDPNKEEFNNLNFSQTFKENLINLFSSRILGITINGDKLLITKYIKMTILTDEEIKKDIDDIEIFYNIIVKEIANHKK